MIFISVIYDIIPCVCVSLTGSVATFIRSHNSAAHQRHTLNKYNSISIMLTTANVMEGAELLKGQWEQSEGWGWGGVDMQL